MSAVLQALRDLGQITPGDVVDGALRIEPMASRHRSIRLLRTGAPPLFVKQARSPETAWLVRREIAFYTDVVPLLGTDVCVPELVAADSELVALVLRHVEGRVELSGRRPRVRLGQVLAAHLGRTLALVHSLELPPDCPAADRPFALDLHLPWVGHLSTLTPGALQFVRLLQGTSGVVDRIDALAAEWRHDTFIHGDLKAGHVLVPASGTAAMPPFIVDWECAGRGDAAWDLGCVAAMYLLDWLRSIPASGDMDAAALAASATVPMAAVRPAISSWWSAYVAARDLSPGSESELRARAITLTGGRLLQAVSEELQVQEQLSAGHVATAQVGMNLLLSEDASAAQLLGLPTDGEGAHAG